VDIIPAYTLASKYMTVISLRLCILARSFLTYYANAVTLIYIQTENSAQGKKANYSSNCMFININTLCKNSRVLNIKDIPTGSIIIHRVQYLNNIS
jgi:hypothetical protein